MKMINAIIPAATGAGTIYIPVPSNMTVLGCDATPSTASGCTSTVDLISGSTTVGSMAIGAAVGAATITSATMNATLATRKTVITKAIPLKIVVDARSNSCAIFLTVYLDEFASQRD